MSSAETNVCYCGAYGGGRHTKSARCDGSPDPEIALRAAARTSKNQLTDREMLIGCLKAMEISQPNPGNTDWTDMIAGIKEHLRGTPETSSGQCLVPDCKRPPMPGAFCEEHNATVGSICGTAVELQPAKKPDFQQWSLDSLDGTMEPKDGGDYYLAEDVDRWLAVKATARLCQKAGDCMLPLDHEGECENRFSEKTEQSKYATGRRCATCFNLINSPFDHAASCYAVPRPAAQSSRLPRCAQCGEEMRSQWHDCPANMVLR